MVLSKGAIKKRIVEKNWVQKLIIEPLFNSISDNDGSASIDFHLGNRFAIFPRRRIGHHRPLKEDSKELPAPEFFVPMGGELVLHPGEVLLGTTLEWFRFPNDLMADVLGRSIWGRRGLLIATAQAVQPGSAGIITLELANVGDVSIYLNPGARIGQLVFHLIQEPSMDDIGRRSPFSGSGRPQLPPYSKSATEKFLLEEFSD